MKTEIKLLIILMGLIVGGCEYGISPEIPAPLSPDGEDYTIEDGKMLFSWEAVQGAQKYAVEIGADRRFTERVYFYVVYGVTDHAVSLDYFEPYEDYFWRVAAYLDADLADWSNPVKFTYVPPFIDLDTTYFPFGLGYEWCYERHFEGFNIVTEEEWDYYDTISTRVTDSFWVVDTLKFEYQGSVIMVGSPVVIFDDMVQIWGVFDIEPTVIPLIPSDSSWSSQYSEDFSTKYSGDTLVIHCGFEPHPTEYNYKESIRIKGIGAIAQSAGSWDMYNFSTERDDRLLYFYDGTDTLYKAPEEALYIGSSANRTPQAPQSEALKRQNLTPPNSGLSEDSQKWLR